MHNRSEQSGFSFLELTIIFALLALLGAFMVPNLFKSKQGSERKEFLVTFENLVKDTVLRAITENKIHQIYIDIVHEVIQMREYNQKSAETNQHKRFKKVQDSAYVTEISFPKRFAFRNFFINQVEEMAAGAQMQDVMFYIMPDGSSQAIIANLVDHDEDGILPEVQFSFVINPFYARMTGYDTFQTP